METVWIIVSAKGTVGLRHYPTWWDAQIAADLRNELAPRQGWTVKPLAV